MEINEANLFYYSGEENCGKHTSDGSWLNKQELVKQHGQPNQSWLNKIVNQNKISHEPVID